ncbi:UDP-N-acetylmuramate--L-alanine ligase [Roseofilum reptotaenium CS-1145]|uniref:UDP-N-acetylmuramate--L-alanine ligase n=1 Tax=Roseofilum reptotaenium AO1-A TaxID=1925591 RepID=A0A1L9QXM9_9CYAN|nr:UDP-N-acetylmuramate--L-alanine ligase [Roseofilum reptotaenium]MDB9516182.1 UDP-N-acetylmuramate--L-alanine ligase [Roseofilum reptotaenium CS-1145]OJJ27347.1 UDP-N-acetylmuramate--L-alanine ligase [Roseofilum reptotaenium AO1-A]
MLSSIDFGGKPFHFIGIGGIGMSALAYILAKRNLPVSGSDIRLSHITERLQEIGTQIFGSQEGKNLEIYHSVTDRSSEQGKAIATALKERNSSDNRNGHLPQVICSTAINTNNAEYKAALELGCPIFHRSDVLAALIQDYRSVAVAGTHGKTTTSSLIGYLLLRAALDPTIIIGGEVKAWEGNARFGQGEFLVAEADESDGSLVKIAAEIGVVTNIELDHPDHYQSLDQVIETFERFKKQCKTLVGCIDCPIVRDRIHPTISYSLNLESGAAYSVDRIIYTSQGTQARVWERGQLLGEIEIPLLGQHNLSNALAAIAVARYLGIPFSTLQEALSSFEGAKRRFEYRGEFKGSMLIDDYAHHPSEIQATLAAASLRAKDQRVIAIFQPHRYSRTQMFLTEFAQSFGQANQVVVTDVYSAGEANLDRFQGETVAQVIGEYHDRVSYQPTLKDVENYLVAHLQPGDYAVFLGAGNLNQIIPKLITHSA